VGFANIAAVADAEVAGQTTYTYFRKVPAITTVQGVWLDLSMIPGSPPPQYYAAAPLTAQPLSRSADGGIRHGGNVSPSTKYLRRWMIWSVVNAAAVPQRFYLLDYLMFYPFVDMGTTDAQVMTNVQTLPRWADGEGVKIMAVLVAPHSLIGDSFTVTYTNSEGTAGRVTPAHTMTTGAAVNGTILTTQSAGAGRFGPFLALQAGDTGVRSIESVTCTAGTDVGLFTLVLVKPTADLTIRELTAPAEKDFLRESARLPVIVDDAYLNIITCPVGSLASRGVDGDMTFVWD
jgi:chitodextrinase